MSSSKDVVAILTNAVSVAGREESGGMMKDQPISILVTGARNGNGQESQQRQLRVKYNDARVSPVWTDEQSSVELSTDSTRVPNVVAQKRVRKVIWISESTTREPVSETGLK